MRFSIRDLLWLTLVVAMRLEWSESYWATNNKRLEAVGQAHRLWAALERILGPPRYCGKPDPAVLDKERLVEP